MLLDKARIIFRIVAGLSAIGYLAWRDITLALAVIFAADLIAWLQSKAPPYPDTTEHRGSEASF